MHSTKTILIAAALSFSAAGIATAKDWRSDRIDDNQSAQARAIEDGRYSGELTRREYRELQAEQARIRDLENRAKADGHVTRREFRDIREAQAEASRHINAETHDGQSSLWRRWLYRHR